MTGRGRGRPVRLWEEQSAVQEQSSFSSSCCTFFSSSCLIEVSIKKQSRRICLPELDFKSAPTLSSSSSPSSSSPSSTPWMSPLAAAGLEGLAIAIEAPAEDSVHGVSIALDQE
jgi:hypothetical protein